jgi:HAMP domain-containing protein
MQMSDGVRIENGRTEISLRDGPLDTQTYQTLLLGLAKQSVFSQQFADVGPRPAQELLREFSAGPHGRTIEALRPAILAVNHGGTVSEADARQWREAMTARIAVWARAVQTTLDELTATTEALSARAKWRLIAFLMGALTVIVAVVCLNRVVLGIVRRLLGELTQVMQKLAERRLAVEVPSRERSDEIGTMARTVEIFKQNAIAFKELEDERAQQKDRAAAEKQAAMRHFADAFEGEVLGVVRTLSTAATQLQQNADVMNSTATETDRQSMRVAAAAEQAIASVRRSPTAPARCHCRSTKSAGRRAPRPRSPPMRSHRPARRRRWCKASKRPPSASARLST